MVNTITDVKLSLLVFCMGFDIVNEKKENGLLHPFPFVLIVKHFKPMK